MTRQRIEWKRPRWTDPLIAPAPYKGAKGGRARGASHFFASLLVLESLANPDLRSVCIREIQKSIKYSAKTLIEDKIREFGLESEFDMLSTETRRRGGSGVIIYQGMQDHTADSIKSLERFLRVWLEEAHTITQRSLSILLPTIMRNDGAQVFASWNPDQPDDAIEQLLVHNPPEGAVVVHADYRDNPFATGEVIRQAERLKRLDPEAYAHIWLGEYNTRSDAQVFAGRYSVEEFEPGDDWDGPYQGLDFGFSRDPTAAVRLWRWNERLFVEHDSSHLGLTLDRTTQTLCNDIPGFASYTTRADSSRSESIDYLRRNGLPRIEAVKKWSGSVEDGIEHMKAYEEIVVHPRCTAVLDELRLYQYKTNRGGDVLAQIKDAHNHCMDAARYGLTPLIRVPKQVLTPWFPGAA